MPTKAKCPADCCAEASATTRGKKGNINRRAGTSNNPIESQTDPNHMNSHQTDSVSGNIDDKHLSAIAAYLKIPIRLYK